MSLKGKLYGIGVGPGDPELITLKAVETIGKCDIIAIPNSGRRERAAFHITERYCAGKPLLDCGFSMEKDTQKRKASRLKAADSVCEALDTGKDVGFITLGDPTIYSTYMYIHRLVAERGYETQIIPGIPSFVAAAAALNISLCEGGEPLHIIPGTMNERVYGLLSLPGNKVIMKSGGGMRGLLEALERRGLPCDVRVVERCGMEGERVFSGLEELPPEGLSYFSIAVVKSQSKNKNEMNI